MARTSAKITQAEIDRVFKAAQKTGLSARIELPGGTVISTMGKVEAQKEVNELDEWLENHARSSEGH